MDKNYLQLCVDLFVWRYISSLYYYYCYNCDFYYLKNFNNPQGSGDDRALAKYPSGSLILDCWLTGLAKKKLVVPL